MHIYAPIKMVDRFLADMTCSNCLTLSNFDPELHMMKLELSDKARTQSSFFMRPSMMLTQMVVIPDIYSRLLFEILPWSGLGM